MLRIYDVLDSQRDFTSNVLDLIQSQESSRLTNAVNRLTILSMFFLPLAFIIGLFELNFITTDPNFTFLQRQYSFVHDHPSVKSIEVTWEL